MQPAERRLAVLELTELGSAETLRALYALRDRISRHHGVAVSPLIVEAVVQQAASMPGPWPAKAITLFDVAAARAALELRAEVQIHHLYLPQCDSPRPGRKTNRDVSIGFGCRG